MAIHHVHTFVVGEKQRQHSTRFHDGHTKSFVKSPGLLLVESGRTIVFSTPHALHLKNTVKAPSSPELSLEQEEEEASSSDRLGAGDLDRRCKLGWATRCCQGGSECAQAPGEGTEEEEAGTSPNRLEREALGNIGMYDLPVPAV